MVIGDLQFSTRYAPRIIDCPNVVALRMPSRGGMLSEKAGLKSPTGTAAKQ